jgi:hypothetical protein
MRAECITVHRGGTRGAPPLRASALGQLHAGPAQGQRVGAAHPAPRVRVCARCRRQQGTRAGGLGGDVLVRCPRGCGALQPRAALGATPLFSTYFPSESCCKKPNFLNENIAPELTRCRQVGVSRVRGGMRTSFSLAPESAYGRPLYIEHPRAQIISDTYGSLVIISYYHRTRGRILFLDPLCVCVFMGM